MMPFFEPLFQRATGSGGRPWGRLAWLARCVDRNGFELHFELWKIEIRRGARRRAEHLLDQRADFSFAVQARRELEAGFAREILESPSFESARAFEELVSRSGRERHARTIYRGPCAEPSSFVSSLLCRLP